MRFDNDVKGKFNLLQQLYKKSSPDIIFVGNSYTKEHVGTHLFKERGVRIFNYGLEGYFIGQLPSMVFNAIKHKPRVIAISILKSEFFASFDFIYNNYNHENGFDLHGLFFLFKHAHSKAGYVYLVKLLGFYILDYNYYATRGYKIKNLIISTYQNFEKDRKEEIPSQGIVSLDCDFDLHSNLVPANCSNGDGVLQGLSKNLIFSDYRKEVNLYSAVINYELIDMLNGLFREIQSAGIKPILILIPLFQHIKVDDQIIRKNVLAEVMDMSDFIMPKEAWYDSVHFNRQGRNVYSIALAKKFKSVLQGDL